MRPGKPGRPWALAHGNGRVAGPPPGPRPRHCTPVLPRAPQPSQNSRSPPAVLGGTPGPGRSGSPYASQSGMLAFSHPVRAGVLGWGRVGWGAPAPASAGTWGRLAKETSSYVCSGGFLGSSSHATARAAPVLWADTWARVSFGAEAGAAGEASPRGADHWTGPCSAQRRQLLGGGRGVRGWRPCSSGRGELGGGVRVWRWAPPPPPSVAAPRQAASTDSSSPGGSLAP